MKSAAVRQGSGLVNKRLHTHTRELLLISYIRVLYSGLRLMTALKREREKEKKERTENRPRWMANTPTRGPHNKTLTLNPSESPPA